MSALVMIAASSLLGAMLGMHFMRASRARVKYFEEGIELVRRIRADVMFRQDALAVTLASFASSAASKLGEHISQFVDQLGQPNPTLSPGVLSNSERQEISALLGRLGRADAETELMQLDAYSQYFADKLDKCRQHYNKFGSLYVKLGALSGLAVGLILL